MADASSVQLQMWIERLNAGDETAEGELIRHACGRLRGLARKLLARDFPRVREWEETDDVLQNALLRLHRALQSPEVRPATVADFLRLAALQIRRELIDLARHHFGPGRPHLVAAPDGPEESTPAAGTPADTTFSPDRLSAWCEFHERVEALPDEERAVVDLLWYQELTQADAAAVLNVSVPTVKRRWLSARLHLQEALGGSGPNW